MEHVVFFPAPDGSPAFRRIPNLEEAVRLVEHLRNVEGVSSVSVHALTEVPLAFRAYYRVEVPDTPQAVPVQPTRDAAHELAPEPVAVEPVVEAPALSLVEDVPTDESPDAVAHAGPDAASNGHAQVAPASLGFFA